MARLELTEKFIRSLKRLPKSRQKRVQKALIKLKSDQIDKGLRLHKLENTDHYSISAGMYDRVIILKIDQETWRLIDVGSHDDVYRRLNR